MRITCPHCGQRSLDEFAYYGDASVTRPDPTAPTAMTDFIRYAYERTNSPGDHRELWYHAAGCHAWLVVTRHMMTHAITSVENARDAALKRAPAPQERA
jgi:methylglutamate dehydrogenase subunit B